MEYVLRKGEVISVVASAMSQTLRVGVGRVWITRGDSRDYLLCEGGRLLVNRTETIVLEALQDSTFALAVADARLPADSVIKFHTAQPHKA